MVISSADLTMSVFSFKEFKMAMFSYAECVNFGGVQHCLCTYLLWQGSAPPNVYIYSGDVQLCQTYVRWRFQQNQIKIFTFYVQLPMPKYILWWCSALPNVCALAMFS